MKVIKTHILSFNLHFPKKIKIKIIISENHQKKFVIQISKGINDFLKCECFFCVSRVDCLGSLLWELGKGGNL